MVNELVIDTNGLIGLDALHCEFICIQDDPWILVSYMYECNTLYNYRDNEYGRWFGVESHNNIVHEDL